MENNPTKDLNSIKEVLDELITAYTTRDTSINFSDWLQDILQDKLPDLNQNDSTKLVADIIESIESYNQTLSHLNTAVDAGYAKEDWVVDQLEEEWSALSTEEAGKHLTDLKDELNPNFETKESTNGDIVDTFSWNRYSLRNTAHDIVRPAIYAVLGITVKTVLCEFEKDGHVPVDEAIKSALQDGVATTPHEVKALVASAVEIAIEQGLASGLSQQNLSVEYIGIISSLAVETIQTLFDSADGDLSGMETLDRLGRASTAAICRAFSVYLKKTVTYTVPAGPLFAVLLDGLFEYLESPQCHESVYAVAQATANVLKEASIATINGVMNSDITIKSAETLQNTLSD